MNKPSAPYFENLDALRFFAFFMVFGRHYFAYGSYEPSPGVEAWVLEKFAMNGRLGVNLFFVLSGFLITYLLVYEKHATGSINVRYFYARRILRIWPLYFLILLLSFFMIPFLANKFSFTDIQEHFLYYAFFINNFDLLNTGFVGIENNNTPVILWSIAIEEQFYLVWPALLLMVNRKYLVHLFSAIITFCLVFRFIHIDEKYIIYFHTFSVMSDLAVGGFLAYAVFYNTNFMAFIVNLKKMFVIPVYFVLILAIIFHEEWSQLNVFTRVFERLLLSLLFAFVVAEQCFCSHSFFKSGKLKVAGRLGIISYGLYCLHLLNIAFVQKMNTLLHITQNNSFVFYSEYIVTFLLCVLTSYLCYKYFEKIFLNLKYKFAVV